MKRKKIDIDEVLKRNWPKLSKEQLEKDKAEVWERLQEHFRKNPEDFKFGQTDDTPAGRAIRRLREVDGLVLRAIQILDGKADLIKMLGIVNDLGEEPVDLDDITMSLNRLDRKGAVSLKALFPMDAPAQDTVPETEDLKARNLAREKS